VRIELGPRDLEKSQVLLVRRDDGSREAVAISGLSTRLPVLLEEIQADLYARALRFCQGNTHSVGDYREFLETIEKQRGFFLAAWCGSGECEEQAKTDTKATIRCISLEGGPVGAADYCLVCGEKATHWVYFARSY